jgi:L-seryl-tRNA(Ser) seleniumtransferase
MRPDKVTMAGVAATLALYRAGRATAEIPVWRMLASPLADLRDRSVAIAGRIGAAVEVAELQATVGGGSLPGETLPSAGIRLAAPGRTNATRLLAALRASTPIVIGRIEDDRVVLDLRTVDPDRDADLADAIERALASRP